MCDRDESWANLNTYQTCLNYRGKMRYKNYSSKEKKKLETVHSIHYRKCLCKPPNTMPGAHRATQISISLKALLKRSWWYLLSSTGNRRKHLWEVRPNDLCWLFKMQLKMPDVRTHPFAPVRVLRKICMRLNKCQDVTKRNPMKTSSNLSYYYCMDFLDSWK